jgi:hypothetical protein
MIHDTPKVRELPVNIVQFPTGRSRAIWVPPRSRSSRGRHHAHPDLSVRDAVKITRPSSFLTLAEKTRELPSGSRSLAMFASTATASSGTNARLGRSVPIVSGALGTRSSSSLKSKKYNGIEALYRTKVSVSVRFLTPPKRRVCSLKHRMDGLFHVQQIKVLGQSSANPPALQSNRVRGSHSRVESLLSD